MATIETHTVRPGEYEQRVTVGALEFGADEPVSGGGGGVAPTPHDYFDASLATCKAITAHWYAKRKGIPLERVDAVVERDDREERRGVYRLIVKLTFHGELTEDQRAQLHRAAAACPITRLMTTAEVKVETVQ
jgi:putative redox protein